MSINKGRFTPAIEGDFVVFTIGMRINKPWKVHKWLPVFFAMPRMLRELGKNPELGLLGSRGYLANPLAPMIVQYWRSFEHLEAFARSKENTHFPAWVKFNKSVGTNGDVGIWHETYRIRAGEFEALYNNMPAFGLGQASTLVPASGRYRTAAGRLGKTDGSDAPVEV
jgi:Domain of unknown function (DUF4188)